MERTARLQVGRAAHDLLRHECSGLDPALRRRGRHADVYVNCSGSRWETQFYKSRSTVKQMCRWRGWVYSGRGCEIQRLSSVVVDEEDVFGFVGVWIALIDSDLKIEASAKGDLH